MRYKGEITHWIEEQGFGFITPVGGGDNVFFHVTSLTNLHRRPIENDIVTYQHNIDNKGRAQAGKIAFADERMAIPAIPTPKSNNMSILLAAVFLIFITGLTLLGKLTFIALGGYYIASIVTFITYAVDKSAAKNNQWRIPESTLHLFALIGGWPGALIAQRLLHHKSKKPSFKFMLWITITVNCSALLLTLNAETLQSILASTRQM
ncbi:MAG: cold shock and DUF1294 domain-containing protein [Methylococcales bacterium]|nr:cold shock and DUF1294 domain-containing protein [Methylococcales bacterium]